MTTIKLYFLCKGTSTNDVLSSFKLDKPKESFFDIFTFTKQNKMKKDKNPRLEQIGIKEIKSLSENEKVKDILKDITSSRLPCIFSALDASSLESSLILLSSLHKSPRFQFYPLPFMSSETDIKNISEFIEYKERFGILDHIKNVSNSNKYWSVSKVNNNFINLRSSDLLINWLFTKNIKSIFSLRSLNFQNFKKLMEKIIISQYSSINKYLFVGNAELISSMLRQIKGKYNSKVNIIERGSLWEITITLNGNDIRYNSFEKVFPTKFNHSPLFIMSERNTITYGYKFKGITFPLFNGIKSIIPQEILNDIVKLTRINSNKLKLVKNSVNSINNKSSKPVTFESLLE
jgi:hypothetical protein